MLSLNVLSVINNEIICKTDKTTFRGHFIEYDRSITVFLNGHTYNFSRKDNLKGYEESGEQSGKIIAPMPGLIKQIAVCEGQSVDKGDRLIAMEAMKMEHSLRAPFNGTITAISVAESDTVGEGAVLLVMESNYAA